jgi:hypothetical protein
LSSLEVLPRAPTTGVLGPMLSGGGATALTAESYRAERTLTVRLIARHCSSLRARKNAAKPAKTAGGHRYEANGTELAKSRA